MFIFLYVSVFYRKQSPSRNMCSPCYIKDICFSRHATKTKQSVDLSYVLIKIAKLFKCIDWKCHISTRFQQIKNIQIIFEAKDSGPSTGVVLAEGCGSLGMSWSSNWNKDLTQGSGIFLAKGTMKPTYFQLYFRESHTVVFNTLMQVTMGVRRNFPGEEAKSTFCMSLSGCWRCNANGRTQRFTLSTPRTKCPMLRQHLHTVFPSKKILHWADVCFSDHEYFKTKLKRCAWTVFWIQTPAASNSIMRFSLL